MVIRKEEQKRCVMTPNYSETREEKYTVSELLSSEDIKGHGRWIKKMEIPKGGAYFDFYKANHEFEFVYVVDGEIEIGAGATDTFSFKTCKSGDIAVSDKKEYIECQHGDDTEATLIVGFFDYIKDPKVGDADQRMSDTMEDYECFRYQGNIFISRENPDEKVRITGFSIDADSLDLMITYQEMYGGCRTLIANCVEFEDMYEEAEED